MDVRGWALLCLLGGCASPSDDPPDATDATADGGAVIVDRDGGPMPRRDYPPGDPGCGLASAAFCDTFDEAAAGGLPEGRSGDLDPRRYVGERGEGSNSGGEAWVVREAATRPCRPGLGERVGVGEDLLICDGNDAIESRHAMFVTAEQDYGQSGVRIRQPFDFYGREGRIVFDLSGHHGGITLGWNAISITEDPSPNPSFALMWNYENTALPRRGVEIQFTGSCQGNADTVSVSHVHVFDNWVDHFIDAGEDDNPNCVSTAPDHLNHFEVRISRTHLEVWATDHSDNGVDYGELVPIFAEDVELPFDRGYVHLTTHNHATLKYSDEEIDAWTSRWDNVGFDGPVIDDRREYSIPNSLTSTSEGGTNFGYQVHDANANEEEEGPGPTFTFRGVDTGGVSGAYVSLNAQVLVSSDGFSYEEYALRYRVNGGEWQEQALHPGPLSGPFAFNEAGENVRAIGEDLGGRLALALPVDPASLRDGDNTLEIETLRVPTAYSPVVGNLDLVLFTD